MHFDLMEGFRIILCELLKVHPGAHQDLKSFMQFDKLPKNCSNEQCMQAGDIHATQASGSATGGYVLGFSV